MKGPRRLLTIEQRMRIPSNKGTNEQNQARRNPKWVRLTDKAKVPGR